MTGWQAKCSNCGEEFILSSHVHLPIILKCPSCGTDMTATRIE